MPLPFHCVGRFTAKLMLDAAASTGAMVPRTWQYSPSVLPVASAAISVAAVTVAPPEASVSAEAGRLAPFSALQASSALSAGWDGLSEVVECRGRRCRAPRPRPTGRRRPRRTRPSMQWLRTRRPPAAPGAARTFDPDVMLSVSSKRMRYLCRHAGDETVSPAWCYVKYMTDAVSIRHEYGWMGVNPAAWPEAG